MCRKIKKLVPNKYDKVKYPLHYRNPKLYLKQGMKLKAVCRIFEFKLLECLKPFINWDTCKRKEENTIGIK